MGLGPRSTGVSSSVLQITVLPNCIKTVYLFLFASTSQWSQNIKWKPLLPLCNVLPELASCECWLEGSLEVSRHWTAASIRSDWLWLCLATKSKLFLWACIALGALGPFAQMELMESTIKYTWGVHLPLHLSGKESQKG